MQHLPPGGGDAIDVIAGALGSADSLLGLMLVLLPMMLVTWEYLTSAPSYRPRRRASLLGHGSPTFSRRAPDQWRRARTSGRVRLHSTAAASIRPVRNGAASPAMHRLRGRTAFTDLARKVTIVRYPY